MNEEPLFNLKAYALELLARDYVRVLSVSNQSLPQKEFSNGGFIERRRVTIELDAGMWQLQAGKVPVQLVQYR